MSIRLRQQIAYWVFLVAGIILLGVQIRKYYLNTLVLSLEEVIVTCVAVALTINPKFILNGINKIIDSRSNVTKNDREIDD